MNPILILSLAPLILEALAARILDGSMVDWPAAEASAVVATDEFIVTFKGNATKAQSTSLGLFGAVTTGWKF